MPVDSAALLVELRGRIAAKPSWGRQDLLRLMAELEQKHLVTEDEFDRALRLTLPAALDVLFNRGPALLDAVQARQGAPAPPAARVPPEHTVSGDARATHRSIAA